MEEETIVPGADRDQQIFRRFVAQYDAPAYVRRARRVQQAWDELLARCRSRRLELLANVRLRLGMAYALAGDWRAFKPFLHDDQLCLLESLFLELKPTLRVPVETTNSKRRLLKALKELKESMDRFNVRWSEEIAKVDLRQLNELRADYNRYYLLEKECSLRSPRLARQGYRPLPPLTTADLAAQLPTLPDLVL
ncbi:MAG: hypothetical protein KatS3mg105_3126 [Gemmatales bacterium]|nr:MAG: hypothetical protein KatS3mg105_3126 [Gemmatales bacterium]